MGLLLRSTVAVGIIWFLVLVCFNVAAIYDDPHRNALIAVAGSLQKIGEDVGYFLAPLLRLALLLAIIISVAQMIGFDLKSIQDSAGLNQISSSGHIQAAIALIIISSVSIAALANVGDVGTLKDLALVVVGFYFGSKKREGELEAVAAGTAAGINAKNPATNVD